MFENLKENIQVWHVAVGIMSFIILIILTVVIFMFSIPQYVTYVETQKMRREVLWIETHAKLANAYGPIFEQYPEYGKFLMYQQNNDLESIGK